jgi:hypothetical protein
VKKQQTEQETKEILQPTNEAIKNEEFITEAEDKQTEQEKTEDKIESPVDLLKQHNVNINGFVELIGKGYKVHLASENDKIRAEKLLKSKGYRTGNNIHNTIVIFNKEEKVNE